MRKKQRTIVAGIATLLAVGLTVSVISLSARIGNIEKTRTIGVSEYKIGFLDDVTGKEPDEQESIGLYMKDFVLVDGLTCELAEDSKIEYTINFYDEDYQFISALDLAEDFDGLNVPVNAKYGKIEIRPTADKDGKVTVFEKSDYAKMLTVTVSK